MPDTKHLKQRYTDPQKEQIQYICFRLLSLLFLLQPLFAQDSSQTLNIALLLKSVLFLLIPILHISPNSSPNLPLPAVSHGSQIMGSGLSALTLASPRSPDVIEEPLGCEHQKIQLELYCSKSGSIWLRPGWIPARFPQDITQHVLSTPLHISCLRFLLPALKELALCGETP